MGRRREAIYRRQRREGMREKRKGENGGGERD